VHGGPADQCALVTAPGLHSGPHFGIVERGGRVVVAAVDQDGGSVLVGDVSPHIGDTTGEGYWLADHGVEYDFHNRIEI
jgi:hypothetical protein